MIEKLRIVAELNKSKDANKYQLIVDILNDKDCFKKVNIKTAYSILSDLGFKDEELRKIYDEVIFDTI